VKLGSNVNPEYLSGKRWVKLRGTVKDIIPDVLNPQLRGAYSGYRFFSTDEPMGEDVDDAVASLSDHELLSGLERAWEDVEAGKENAYRKVNQYLSEACLRGLDVISLGE